MEYKEPDRPPVSRLRLRNAEDTAQEACERRLAGRAGAGKTDEESPVCGKVVGHFLRPW
jgi:hypothetical protein